MVNFALINVILHNFLQNHIKWLFILHCWDKGTQFEFSSQAMKENLFLQMWPINQLKLEGVLEGRILSQEIPHVAIYLDMSCLKSSNIMTKNSLAAQFQFSSRAMNENLFIQMWSINKLKLEGDLEGPILSHENPHVAIYFDMNCTKSEDILRKASEEKLFKHQFHWLIYDSSMDLEHFKDLFKYFHLSIDTDITLVQPNERFVNSPKNVSYILYDVYNNGYSLGGKLNVTIDRELLCCREQCLVKRYLSSLYQRSKYEHRWYLRDLTMRVSTVVTAIPLTAPQSELLAHLSSTKDKHIDGIAKFGFQYLMILKENLECNFFYNFTSAWSRTEVNGGCIGAIGIENSADLASSPFLATKNRFKYVQAITELGTFRHVCIFRTPLNAGIQSAVFLEPFSLRVWILFGATLILIAFLLWLTFFVEYHQMKAMLGFVPSLLTTCLISFGSACYQGSFLVPTSMGGRIAFITLSLLTFIIYNYYTSIVVAILLGSPVKSNIKTVAQLADSKLEVGLEPIPYTKSYLNFSTLPEIKRFVRNKIDSQPNPNNVWMSVEKGLQRVRKEPGYVFVIDAFSGYGLIENSYTAEEI
ncbi:Glutamate receptor [Lucilia cuprina]|nr:Glutamate receptor [Lucilia cuprina]